MKRSASVKLLGRGSGVTSSCLAFELSIGRVTSASAVTVTSAATEITKCVRSWSRGSTL